jgi:hypothetical protein
MVDFAEWTLHVTNVWRILKGKYLPISETLSIDILNDTLMRKKRRKLTTLQTS